MVETRGPHKVLTPAGIALITRVIRDRFPLRVSRFVRACSRHITPFNNLNVSLLDCQIALIHDPFEVTAVLRHLETTATQKDHAAKLSYLWPALRRLASAPYVDPQYATYHLLWEKLASAWDYSAAWYGLHDDTPISKLAAVNTFLWLLENSALTALNPDFAHGSRASAYYSMARRLWLPWQRRKLFLQALNEIDGAIATKPKDPSGCFAIRGSIFLRLWHVRRAISDYETVVAIRMQQNFSPSSTGEAWVELGWGYLWAFRFSKAKHALRNGIALMREDFQRDPTLRQEFFVRALMKCSMAYFLMLNVREAKAAAAEGCKLAHEGVVNDQVRGLRRLVCRIIADPKQA